MRQDKNRVGGFYPQNIPGTNFDKRLYKAGGLARLLSVFLVHFIFFTLSYIPGVKVPDCHSGVIMDGDIGESPMVK